MGRQVFQPFSIKYQNNLANLTTLWYTKDATQFHIFSVNGYTGIWCILISVYREKMCGNNDGILDAGVPSLECPYFLPFMPPKEGRVCQNIDKKGDSCQKIELFCEKFCQKY